MIDNVYSSKLLYGNNDDDGENDMADVDGDNKHDTAT